MSGWEDQTFSPPFSYYFLVYKGTSHAFGFLSSCYLPGCFSAKTSLCYSWNPPSQHALLPWFEIRSSSYLDHSCMCATPVTDQVHPLKNSRPAKILAGNPARLPTLLKATHGGKPHLRQIRRDHSSGQSTFCKSQALRCKAIRRPPSLSAATEWKVSHMEKNKCD
jgi:hypothetical protein